MPSDPSRRKPGERPTAREVRESIVVRSTPSFISVPVTLPSGHYLEHPADYIPPGPPVFSKVPYVNRLGRERRGSAIPLYAGFPDVAKQGSRGDHFCAYPSFGTHERNSFFAGSMTLTTKGRTSISTRL